MKIYSRIIRKRAPINRFGKLGYPEFIEYFKTDDPSFLEASNSRKQIKFIEHTGDVLEIPCSNHIYCDKL